MPAKTSAGYTVIIGQTNPDLTLSAASVTMVGLAPDQAFTHWFQRVIVQAGAGAYTYQLAVGQLSSLPAPPHLPGALFLVRLEFAASVNPTIEIYDTVSDMNLLQTVTGVSDHADVFLFESIFNGSGWAKYDGRYVI